MNKKESGSVSRRGFLAGTAVAGAGLLAGLTACDGNASTEKSQNVSAADIKWDHECDVLVAGSGSGLAAAVAAADSGAEVIVVEKREVVGGSIAFSGGGVWIPNRANSREHGDTEEKARAYLSLMRRDEGSEELSESFLLNGQMMLDFLERTCNIEWSAGSGTDYHPEWEGAAIGRGGGAAARKDEDTSGGLAGGGRLVNRLIEGVDSLGVEILLSTAASKLITQTNSEGANEVIGIEATQGSKTINIKARKGVVLSTGGFEWDDELRQHYIGGPAEFKRSVPENTGDALRMVMRIGADLRMMNACWGNVVYREDSKRLNDVGGVVGIALLMDRAKPGTIMVDKSGRRFCNEAADYDSLWWAFRNRETHGAMDYTAAEGAYLIADADMVAKFGLCTSDNDPSKGAPDYTIIADTIEDLAVKLNMDPTQLTNTITRFNEYAKQGIDPDFHRGESIFDRTFMVDDDFKEKPEATLRALENGPFYALEVATASAGTHGGPKVNKDSQVIDVDGNVIPRLYAAGNTAAIGAPGMVYGGPGGTIGPALVFNVLAGIHAASLSPVE